jgi:hypothetical protein
MWTILTEVYRKFTKTLQAKASPAGKNCGVEQPGGCQGSAFKGRLDVTGLIGNKLLVNSNFYMRNNFSENYP